MDNLEISVEKRDFLSKVMIVSTFGGLLFGYDTGVVNGALPYMARQDQLNLTPFMEGWVVSALLFGAACGSIACGRLADKFGRRKSIIYLAVMFFFAALGCTLSPNIYVMVCCRFILGLAVGGASVTVPTYLAEMSPIDKRGRIVTQNELMIVSGQFLAFVFNAIFGVTMGDSGHVWRYMLFMATLPAIILFFGMLRMPESPRWLAVSGRVSEALDVLSRVRQSKNIAVAELNEIQDNLNAKESKEEITFKDLTKPWILRIVLLGIGISVATRFTGVNTIMFYGTQILTNAGFSTQSALIANVANGLTSVGATFFGMWLLNKIGRRTIFLFGLTGTTTSLLLIALSSYFLDGTSILPYVVLSLTVMFLFFMQGGIGPVLWLLLAEIFPVKLRGLGMGICVFFLWITDFCIGLAFPVLLNRFGLFMTFMVFVISGLAGLVFVKTCIPETKGRSLEDIERYFRSFDKSQTVDESSIKCLTKD